MYYCKVLNDFGVVEHWYVDPEDLSSFLSSHNVIEYCDEDFYFQRVKDKDYKWEVITL